MEEIKSKTHAMSCHLADEVLNLQLVEIKLNYFGVRRVAGSRGYGKMMGDAGFSSSCLK
ncbi:MAG: hypothetical protein KG012_09765 [Deltaproteobacteria bacterium]|nr:hypothetical protein [Deltaproteobacteria bacterium]